MFIFNFRPQCHVYEHYDASCESCQSHLHAYAPVKVYD